MLLFHSKLLVYQRVILNQPQSISGWLIDFHFFADQFRVHVNPAFIAPNDVAPQRLRNNWGGSTSWVHIPPESIMCFPKITTWKGPKIEPTELPQFLFFEAGIEFAGSNFEKDGTPRKSFNVWYPHSTINKPCISVNHIQFPIINPPHIAHPSNI